MASRHTDDGSWDDAAMAAAVDAGDREALESVFSLYGGAVKAVVLRVLNNETLAEDVVQDVFVSFWKSPEKFDSSRGSLRTFLLTIAGAMGNDPGASTFTWTGEVAGFALTREVAGGVVSSEGDVVSVIEGL